jgi:hypothetical protein
MHSYDSKDSLTISSSKVKLREHHHYHFWHSMFLLTTNN